MTSILLTGITGFVGSELGRRLVEEGFSVYALMRHTSTRSLEPISDYADRIHLIYGDLREYHTIRSVVREAEPEIIAHLGAITPVRMSFEDPFSNIDINTRGTANLTHAALNYAPRLRRFILASTMEVYGWQDRHEPFSEELPLHPASPYAVSKAAADMYVRMMGRVNDLPYTVLRPCNSFGRKFETGYVVEYLITSMLRGENVYVGTPNSERDMLFVEDHVEAYLKLIKEKAGEKQTFNVGTGKPVRMIALAHQIAQIVGYNRKIIEGYPLDYPRRPGFADPEYLSLNAARIEEALQWRPKYELADGLGRTIDYWRKRLKV